MTRLCVEAGRKPPKPGDLALHLLLSQNGKRLRTIYRRTGPDMWARLDRQFLIKLQGENETGRKASPDEYAAVQQFEAWLGRIRTKDNPLPHNIVSLMADAVHTARLGLRRHGDRARIAFNLKTDRKPLPGDRWEELTSDRRREFLEDTLILWQSLFQSPRWRDDWAKEMWHTYVQAELPPAPGEDATQADLKTYNRNLRKLLTDYAAKLAGNPQLRMKLHTIWATRWREDDKQWKGHLRWLRNWLLPRGRPKSDASIRHVGGLSLDRLANIRELWQAMKAYTTRPEPEDIRRNTPEKGDIRLDNYGQRVLNTLEHLRENRVKQLASRIVEAALGIGSEDKKHWEGGKRPQKPIVEPRFKPCHAVVVENLDSYRPEQIRTRRENRQLMQWSAVKVLRYLKEACELNGLHLRQVIPNYTSRQDSRTGAPGARCTDLPVPEFLRRYERLVKNAAGAENEYLEALKAKWDGCTDNTKLVRILDRSGELFVSADRNSPASKGIQADLNAAANIGLRALLDPDWPGRWWWIPCGRNGKPAKDRCKGTKAFDLNGQLLSETVDKDVVNAWRDVSAAAIESDSWQSSIEYWNKVKFRVIERLREWAGL